MVLRPRATKLLIPNSGPYLVTGSTRHTYLLRNIATGFAFAEHRSNVRPMMSLPATPRARDVPSGIGEMLGEAGMQQGGATGQRSIPEQGNPRLKSALKAANPAAMPQLRSRGD